MYYISAIAPKIVKRQRTERPEANYIISQGSFKNKSSSINRFAKYESFKC